jgi:hypothetical protein
MVPARLASGALIERSIFSGAGYDAAPKVLILETSFKTLVFGAYDFSLAHTFQITLVGNSFTRSFRILIGYNAFR